MKYATINDLSLPGYPDWYLGKSKKWARRRNKARERIINRDIITSSTLGKTEFCQFVK